MTPEPPRYLNTIGRFVAGNELTVRRPGRAAVRPAYSNRFGAIDTCPEVRRPQIWAGTTDPCTLVNVSLRVLGGDSRPRPRRFSCVDVVAR